MIKKNKKKKKKNKTKKENQIRNERKYTMKMICKKLRM